MRAFLILAALFTATVAHGQDGVLRYAQETPHEDPEALKVIYINKDVSTHFIAMENIRYVDISIGDIVGDIPLSNTVRVKPVEQGASGVITIAMERYFVQYMLVYTDSISQAYTRFSIPYGDLRSYVNPETQLTASELYNYASRMAASDNRYFNVSTAANLMRLTLNNIYTIDRYFFIDVSLLNRSRIMYDIDQVRFKIEDKKQTKATNFQSVEILPLLEFTQAKNFKRHYRNVYVFEKFTFPNEKVFTIEFSERQISGRTIILRIDYSDVLRADGFAD